MSTADTVPAAGEGRLALENERLRRAVTELSVLNDLARAIGASVDLADILHRIVTRSIKSLHAQEGVITLVDVACDEARTLVREVMSSANIEAFHMRGALLGWMQLHQKPLLVDEPDTDERFHGVRWDPGVESLLAVPLLVKGMLTGVLTVYNKQSSAKFDSDDQRLLAIIASQSAQVIENARLHEEERKLASVNEQIRLAADVQMHLLPDVIPEVDGYQIAGTSVAAEVVGGDYYDVVPLEGGRLALCLGDVSGKGLPASLLMANVQAMVRLMGTLGFSSSETMRHANELLCRCTAGNRFVTFFLAILDPGSGVIEYCNAGHNPPVLVSSTGECRRLATKGAVLGMLPHVAYQGDRMQISPGDLLTIFSDGVTEAMSPEDEEYGEARLVELLCERARGDAASTLKELLAAIRSHASDRSQSDDITLLVLKRTDASIGKGGAP